MSETQAALERDIANVKAPAERLINAFANPQIAGSRNLVEDRLTDLEHRREDIELGLAEVGADLATMARNTVTATTITAAIVRFRDLYACLRPHEQRDLMSLLVSRVEVRDREIVLELYPDACRALYKCRITSKRAPTL